MKKDLPKIFKKLFILGLFFIVLEKVWAYGSNDDTNSYTRITMHEFYAQENIDVLFLGASHMYRTINPQIADSLLELNTFNLGSSNQTIDESYFMLKEALKENNIKKVYLEVNPVILRLKDEPTTSIMILSDYMKPSFNKINFILNCAARDNYHNIFSKARRNSTNFSFHIIKKKLSKEYKSYDYIKSSDEYYFGKGFVYNENNLAEDYKLPDNKWKKYYTHIDLNDISQRQMEYLNKMISLCNQEEIQLILFTAPMPEKTMNTCDNFMDFVQYMKEFSRNSDITYTDFNLEYSLDLDNTYFSDYNHLNGRGADFFTYHLFSK